MKPRPLQQNQRQGATIELFYVMLPVIVGTAFFNAIVVQVLAAPLKKVLGR